MEENERNHGKKPPDEPRLDPGLADDKMAIRILKEAQLLRCRKKCFLVGQRIRQLREKQGLTQRALAQRIFVSKSYISQIENGKINLTLASLSIIAEGLQTDLYRLVEFEESNIYSLEYIISKLPGLTPERLRLVGKFLDTISI